MSPQFRCDDNCSLVRIDRHFGADRDHTEVPTEFVPADVVEARASMEFFDGASKNDVGGSDGW
ncbi:hypothetical protein ACWEV3_24910 [Saccharopolyspora sp. NPDC003752]